MSPLAPPPPPPRGRGLPLDAQATVTASGGRPGGSRKKPRDGDGDDGFDPGSDGGGSSPEEDTAKETPYQCATRIFVAWAEEKGTEER